MASDGPTSSKTSGDNPRKIFNDPVHGTIELHPLCVKIIDTPQFQRLRRLKQLGVCYYVYPGATHSRFEHSIGVAHLAEIMVKELHQRQPELKIKPIDILCVTIAGLCHDLGHGPISHTFEQFIQRGNPKWTHEKASIDMFDHLIEVNDMRPTFIKHGFNKTKLETYLEFIKELIYGILPGKNALTGRPSTPVSDQGKNALTGKPSTPVSDQDNNESIEIKKKLFLYEIVNNKRTSVDVDKWDYFARDCLMVGMKSNFDHMRCMKFTRAIKVGPGDISLCIRDKEVSNIYEMFHIRNNLHRRVYKHAVTIAVEMMYVDALVLAEESGGITFTGKNGEEKKISKCIDDMVAYTKLTDHIFYQILHSTDDRLQSARELLERVENRQLYKCIGQAILPTDVEKKEIEKKALKEVLEKDNTLAGKIAMKFVDLGYKEHPIKSMLFYSKANPNEASEMAANKEPQLVPKIFEEFTMSIYYKDIAMGPEEIGRAQDAFAAWCKDKDYTIKADSSNRTVLTPE